MLGYGYGIVKGLLVTIKHFVETYLYDLGKFPRLHSSSDGRYERQKATARGLFTVQYPEERLEMFPRFRGALMHLRNPETGEIRCTACEICVRACPHDCLALVGEGKGKERRAVAYTWNSGSCMFCGLCVEACPFDAIAMSPDYNLASFSRDLMEDLETLLTRGDRYATQVETAADLVKEEVAS